MYLATSTKYNDISELFRCAAYCLQLWILQTQSQSFNVLDFPISKYAENDLKKKNNNN